jgi:predicted ATPase/DNA-binding CsgD family transcriptional regulator
MSDRPGEHRGEHDRLSSITETREQDVKRSKPLWNVPAAFTPLVGREQDVAAICALFAQPGICLVTLLGAGGIGKTRLSLEVARQLRGSFADGVCFVSLAAIRDAELLFPIIAQELALQDADRSWKEQMWEFLREKRLLLILDNFEQLLPAASLIEELLVACPLLHVLVTSRVVLHSAAERQYWLAPLAVPDLQQLPGSEEIAHYAAIELFAQRARALQPDFQITPANATVIAGICARLDGIPLAIELAAARIKLLPPQALLPRLTHSLQVLTKGLPTQPTRQQTLRSAIQWSYDLLNTREQRIFRLCSVFSGGFTLSAIEGLATHLDETGGELAEMTLDDVESLIDKSLLQAPRQENGDEGEARLNMLETIREYGLECLQASGEMAAARRAHALVYVKFAEEQTTAQTGAALEQTFRRLEREHDNLRAAMTWLLEENATAERRPPEELALRLGRALGVFWLARGYLHEGWAFLEQALPDSPGGDRRDQSAPSPTMNRGATNRETTNREATAWAFRFAADIIMRLGNVARAEALLTESLQRFRALEDRENIASCLRGLGWIAHQKRELEQARTFYEESLALYKELGHGQGIASTLLNIAFIEQTRGDFGQARALLEESLALHRALQNKTGIYSTLYQLAQVIFGAEEPPPVNQIRLLLEEGLDLAREAGDKRAAAAMQGMLGWLSFRQGNLPVAALQVEACLQFFREGGDRLIAGSYLELLAEIRTAQGDYTAAQALFRESLAISKELGEETDELTATCMEGMATMAVAQGYHAWAVRMWAAAAAWREAREFPEMPAIHVLRAREIAAVRAFLGDALFEPLWTEGRAMSPDQALSARWLPSPTQPPSSTSKKKPLAYPSGLSAREVEVLRLVAQGLSDAEVADRLIVSPRTVTTHLTSIYNKLGVNSRVAATRFAVENHLI